MIELSLLGGFVFSVGGEAVAGISQGSQRLIVFLALSDRLVTRHAVARALWPGSSTVHGSDSLRSAVSRLDSRISETVRVTAVGLGLAESVIVDFRHALSVARWMVDRDTPQDGTDIGTAAVSALSKDLLPGWYDEWVIVAAEDWHQRRMHALEAATARLTAAGRLAEAAAAALAAVRAEPLRESARAARIRVYLAEGNQSDAQDEFERYRVLLRAELGIEPTSRLSQLLSGFEPR